MAPRATGSFPCEDCGSVFSRKEYVERHRRLTHLGHRPYPCEACGRGFARSDLLKRHLTTCATIKKQKADGSAAKNNNSTSPSTSSGSPIEASPTSGPPPIAIPREELAYTQVTPPGVIGPYPNGAGTAPMSATELVASYGAHSYPSSTNSETSPSIFSSTGSDQSPQTGDSSVGNSPDDSFFPGQSALSLANDVGKLIGGGFGAPDATTLAPTLSTSNPWAGFGKPQPPASDLTANEIEASEVLHKLLQSPRMSPAANAGYSQDLAQSYFGESAWNAPDPNLQSLMPGYTPGGLMGTGNSLWDDPGLNIEFGQEATALAEYFNQGGIGGITALDLGFPVTPSSLYPSHLFEPRQVEDMRLHIPNEKFCQGFLYPWKDSLPGVGDMEKYAIAATKKLLPSIPVMHEPTMRFTDMSNHSVFALSVAGGAFDVGAQGEQFSGTMVSLKRVYIVKSFNRPENTDDDRFQHLQSMLLYQLVGFYRDEQHRQMSHTFHSGLCQMFRQLDLVSKIRRAKVPSVVGLSGEELENAWKEWVKVETWRRVAFIVYLIDLETATHFNVNPVLSFSELEIDLPSAECLWKATNAVEFQKIKASPILPPATHFLTAIRALLASAKCSPFSEDGLILNELSRLDPLCLLILSRSLSFLQMKTEEAISQSDPFRSMLGGIMGKQEGEEQEVLRRIKAGLNYLRKLPGGAQRGGGESWFTEVMPQSTGADSPAGRKTAAVLTSAVMRAVQMDTDALASQYPDFVGLPAETGQAHGMPVPLRGM